MPIPLAALKTELQTDPTALGLTAPYDAGQDSIAADLLNRPNVAIRMDVEVPAAVFVEAIDRTEYLVLADGDKRMLQLLATPDTVRLRNPALGAMFPLGTQTRTNLQFLAKRAGSRAEQLWGAGAFVAHSDVAATRSI